MSAAPQVPAGQLPVVGIVTLVFCIIAALAANKGEAYHYPFTARLVK